MMIADLKRMQASKFELQTLSTMFIAFTITSSVYQKEIRISIPVVCLSVRLFN